MGKQKSNNFDYPEEARKEIERLEKENKALRDDRDFYEKNLKLLQSAFATKNGQQQRLLFTNAKNSFDKYKNDRLRCLYHSYTPDVVQNGFRLDLDKLTELQAKNPKSYFLLFGKRPSGVFAQPNQPGSPTNPQHGDPEAFQPTLTLLVLGLNSENKFLVEKDPDTNLDKPIVYEYLSPCPNSCDGVDAEIAKYF